MNPRSLLAVGCTSAALLVTELALTRIFSVVMYYHFAFLAISIALFGLSASGVYAYMRRARLDRVATESLLANRALFHAVSTIVALFVLVRLRVGLNYSPQNLGLMLTIYGLAALPFFSGGLVITLAISTAGVPDQRRVRRRPHRRRGRMPRAHPAARPDRRPRRGADGIGTGRWRPCSSRGRARAARYGALAASISVLPLIGQFSGLAGFDVVDTKGHQGDRVLFSKWNSFSRIGVYEREHGDWSLSPAYTGALPETRFMDIDSAASTPILRVAPDLSNAQYLAV